jgi:molybdenum-dependent DNA-binding transcriptional regulator ModE
MLTTETPDTDEKTRAMLDIEQRFGGQDVRDLVADSYSRTGSLRKVAKELGCSHSLVWDVIDRFDGVYGKTITFPGRPGFSGAEAGTE